jgi:TrmH family RNA methyltransferase
MKTITSRHNPMVARYREAARGRNRAGAMLLDGTHLLDEALRAGVRLLSVAYSRRALDAPDVARLVEDARAAGADACLVTDDVLDAMSPAATPSGVVALADRPSPPLRDAFAGPTPLVLVAVDVQDPGNVGALVRAAEAAGATSVVTTGASADPFGWKALRGSMGSAFRVPVVMAGLDDVLAEANAAGVTVAAAVPRTGASMYEVDLARPVALLLGGEGPGLPDEVIRRAAARVTIPMRPPVESLNVATAAAVLVYEAARQRRVRG